MSFIFRCVGSLFLASCSTGCVSTQSVAEHLGTRYVGKSFDEFVIVHGAPYKSFALSSGETAYVWNSGVTSVGMPLRLQLPGTEIWQPQHFQEAAPLICLAKFSS